jgi:hypothetical protein
MEPCRRGRSSKSPFDDGTRAPAIDVDGTLAD